MKVNVYNQEGQEVGTIELNDAVFGIEPNNQAVFDMVMLQRAATRQGTHSTKGRSEVRGGGRKPWRQKGSGRARQGSIRAPQWRGGGKVFGPKPRKYGFKINRKVARLALRSALSGKVIDSELTVLDGISVPAPKTKTMAGILNNIKAGGKVLLVTDEIDENVKLSSRNLPNVMYLDAAGINVYDILNCDRMIVTTAAVQKIEEALG